VPVNRRRLFRSIYTAFSRLRAAVAELDQHSVTHAGANVLQPRDTEGPAVGDAVTTTPRPISRPALVAVAAAAPVHTTAVAAVAATG
jgi:hypothetical protein